MSNENISTIMDRFLPDTGRLATSIVENAGSSIFKFMTNERFQSLAQHDTAEAARVYWREILYRSHLAAVTALSRHARWIAACSRHYGAEPNYLGLACCLRGMLEAAADTFYSLRAVPLTIANSMELIRQALLGERETRDYIAEDLEHLLIHFLYAKKWDAKTQSSWLHRSEPAAKYIQCLVDENNDAVRQMYSELCNLTHPAAPSVSWMLKTSPDLSQLQFGGTYDDRFIRQLVEKHGDAIRTVVTIPLDISVSSLRVLNRLPLQEVHVPISEAYEPTSWNQIESLMRTTGEFPRK